MAANCPICGYNGVCIRTLSSEYLREQLEYYFNEKPPSSICVRTYNILRCSHCSLEYAVPMIGGTSEYYDWIGGHLGYYPNHRWDYDAVIARLAKKDGGTILDVGCGSGLFLEDVRRLTNFKAVGLDVSKKAVEQCKNKGLVAYKEPLETFVSKVSSDEQQFDYVVSFHCLEHVKNPLEFVRLMTIILKYGGKIYLSTPYSPMSFEYSWFDVQNHPPHHLTRWNVDSYKALAKKLDCCVEFLFPSPGSILQRAQTSLKIRWFGPGRSVSRKNFAKKILLTPNESISEVFQQMKREKVNGKVAPNVILVKFWKDKCVGQSPVH